MDDDLIYMDCDLVITFDKVYDTERTSPNDYLNAGTCSYTVTDSVTGEVKAEGVLTYVAASQGKYKATIPAVSGMKAYRFYYVDLAFDQDGITASRRQKRKAVPAP
jgi:predicted Zn-dependent protease